MQSKAWISGLSEKQALQGEQPGMQYYVLHYRGIGNEAKSPDVQPIHTCTTIFKPALSTSHHLKPFSI